MTLRERFWAKVDRRGPDECWIWTGSLSAGRYGGFSSGPSRYHEPVSELCAPDKVAAFLMPRWLYITLTRWTGELEEYMAEADTPAGRKAGISIESPEAWFDSVKAHLDVVAKRIVDGGDPGVPPTRSEHLHGVRTGDL